VDISHGGERATTRELATLAGLWTAVLIAGIGGLRLTGLMIERADKWSTVAPFGGWQLYAMAAAIGATCLLALALALRLGRRRFRSVRGRTPYHRVAVMAAIVPGLVLGIALASTLQPALSWASDHTAAAAKARATWLKVIVDYRKGPPPIRLQDVSPGDARRKLLLDATTLGKGWSATITESFVGPAAAAGELSELRATMLQQHWSAPTWHLDQLVDPERSVTVAARRSRTCQLLAFTLWSARTAERLHATTALRSASAHTSSHCWSPRAAILAQTPCLSSSSYVRPSPERQPPSRRLGGGSASSRPRGPCRSSG